ncbi:TolC family protein [Solimonas sp. K1W22B-7]|uniref:TolC family protein n=1 Tax=Solimonas sp. K1W22B-7 TaxID=2303331 RepID=UPI000E330339|nr:TolC family protein [Solimonas sp. K1W22B-7]AXQ28850.1 TolC family protein [Solimonas sp. K1W22B-7]
MFRISPRALPALGLFVSLAAAASEPAVFAGPPLTLAAALQRAETQHPAFGQWRAAGLAAASRVSQAGLRPAPELHLAAENLLGSGPYRGAQGAETTLSFSQLVEASGQRSGRIDTARAEQALQAGEAGLAALDLRAELARRYVHLLSDQAQLEITHEATALAEETLREVERRVAAARSPLAERSRARIALERARLAEEHAEHELLSSRRHLAAAMGQQEPDFGSAQGDLLQRYPTVGFEVLLARLQASPQALQYASENRLRESELRLQQARAGRSLTLGAGVRRLGETDDTALLFSASLPLGQAARAEPLIAEAQARRDQGEAASRSAMLKLQAQLYELFQELNHARTEFEAQRDRIVPAADEALRQTRHAWERGRYSLLELRDAHGEWTAQRRRLIEAAAEYQGYLIEIQRLTGQPVGAVQKD